MRIAAMGRATSPLPSWCAHVRTCMHPVRARDRRDYAEAVGEDSHQDCRCRLRESGALCAQQPLLLSCCAGLVARLITGRLECLHARVCVLHVLLVHRRCQPCAHVRMCVHAQILDALLELMLVTHSQGNMSRATVRLQRRGGPHRTRHGLLSTRVRDVPCCRMCCFIAWLVCTAMPCFR